MIEDEGAVLSPLSARLIVLLRVLLRDGRDARRQIVASRSLNRERGVGGDDILLQMALPRLVVEVGVDHADDKSASSEDDPDRSTVHVSLLFF